MSTDNPRPQPANVGWLMAAALVAVCGVAGSVYLSVGMKLKACPLCFYQRTFVMSVAAVLVIGLATDRTRTSLLALVCLPLAVGGLAVAGFHEYLELSGKLECPRALFGLGTAPQQSLALFIGLSSLLLIAARREVASACGAALLGLALAWACIASAPPMPAAPDKPYEQPLDICRPPYQRAAAG